jgi:hypothetical protein
VGESASALLALAVSLHDRLDGTALYLAAVLLAFLQPWIAIALYAFVALMWLIPDRRIEHVVESNARRD